MISSDKTSEIVALPGADENDFDNGEDQKSPSTSLSDDEKELDTNEKSNDQVKEQGLGSPFKFLSGNPQVKTTD